MEPTSEEMLWLEPGRRELGPAAASKEALLGIPGSGASPLWLHEHLLPLVAALPSQES